MKKKKKEEDLDLTIKVVDSDGSTYVFPDLTEASKSLKVTERQLRLRATDQIVVDGKFYMWDNPSTRRHFMGIKSRRKGNGWEREILSDLRSYGYQNVVTARQESRSMDGKKVDIIDLDHHLPVYIQAKCVKRIPSYHAIWKSCPKMDKPFVMAVKIPKEKPIAIMELDYFYKLIERK